VTIYCRSIVDVIRQASPASKELSLYRVTVEGRPPLDYVRMYDISAKVEDDAAREGLARFQDEIGKLIEGTEG
jgi:hypothetical protein